MKAIMISIKPKWVAKILNGEKTIEIRKTMPKCDLPIDVYIYCTKSNNYKESLYEVWTKNTNKKSYDVDYYIPSNPDFILNGKVVAKFTLNNYIKYKIHPEKELDSEDKEILKSTCLSVEETIAYSNKKPIFDWHISNLEIFDKPKELGEFEQKWYCKGLDKSLLHPLTKAPQSWCYVEVE